MNDYGRPMPLPCPICAWRTLTMYMYQCNTSCSYSSLRIPCFISYVHHSTTLLSLSFCMSHHICVDPFLHPSYCLVPSSLFNGNDLTVMPYNSETTSANANASASSSSSDRTNSSSTTIMVCCDVLQPIREWRSHLCAATTLTSNPPTQRAG